MKKLVVLFVLFYFVSFISSYYACADNSSFSTDVREIDLGKTKIINGLNLGLKNARETPLLKRMEAELLVDSQAVSLVDNNYTSIMFMNEKTYNISLNSSTESRATITIESKTETIEKGETKAIGTFDVFVFNSEGTYPGTAKVDVLVGRSSISLSSTDNPGGIVTIGGRDYSLEIFSASNENALIKVGKCAKENMTMVKIADPVKENNTESNQTEPEENNSAGNESQINNSNSEIQTNNSTAENESGQTDQSKEKNQNAIIYTITAGVFILAVITFIIILGRSRKLKTMQTLS